MEDPNLIATLIPIDNKNRAEKAFRHADNESRYLPPIQGIAEGPTLFSREVTPAQGLSDDDDHDYNFTHRLQLTFDEEPEDVTKGYSFGTDSRKCDVSLGPRGAYLISGRHFCITFDDTIDEKPHLVLRDSSTNGMAVSYNGQASKEVRHHFTWILDLEKEEGEWEVKVHVQGLEFKIELASHKTCQAKYDEKVNDFLEKSRTSLPPLGTLGMESYTTTAQPSQPLTPRQLPIYISEGNLGSGSFGNVDKVIDVSTGAIYARKEFQEPSLAKSMERRRQQKEDWLNQVRREIRIMRENPHENIVQVVDFREGPLPFLVMPYFLLGNLEDLHSESPIAIEETVAICFQALNAFQYLHARGVAHRDLKPENILIESRSPLSIKLADFGLANDRPDLKTICGTKRYAAPEVCLGSRYTTSVDLWSLGVIILQYLYGLPSEPRQRHQNQLLKLNEWGLAWCRRVINHANVWDSDKLITLLTTGMLRMKPEERLSAGACLTKGCSLQLFDSHPLNSGNVTPKWGMAGHGDSGDDDDDGSTTILLGALWDTDGEVLNQDDNDRIGLYPLKRTSGDNRDSQLGRLGTGFEHGGRSVRSLSSDSHPLEAGSKYLGRYKRQRSTVVGSTNTSSSRERVKRRPTENYLTQIVVDDNRSESWPVTSIDSHLQIPPARRKGLTYPSAFLDVTNISGCSMPVSVDQLR